VFALTIDGNRQLVAAIAATRARDG